MKSLAVSTLFLFSLSGYSMSLDQAYQTSADNSHELKQMRLEFESAKWGKLKATADYLPKLELEGRHLFDNRFEIITLPFNGTVVSMPAIQPYTSLGVEATWNIFKGFETNNAVQAAEAKKEAAEYRLRRSEEKNRALIRTLFYRALGLQILVDVATQNVATLESHLNDVQVRVRNGVSTRYDSLRVEVQLEDAKTEKLDAENNVVIARAKLFQAIATPDDGKPLEGKLPDDFPKIDITKLGIETVKRNDRAALIAEQEESLRHEKAASAHWYPSISLFGNYEWYNNINKDTTESDNRFQSAYALGVRMTWNIFDGGASYASQKQAALANQISTEKLSQFDESLPADLEDARRRFSYDVINFNAKLSSIRKAEEAVRLARNGLKAGTRTNTEVLDAVVDLHRAQAAAVKSQIDAIEALGQLELTTGKSL